MQIGRAFGVSRPHGTTRSISPRKRSRRVTFFFPADSAGAKHFGLKAHIGVDAASGLVHTVTATAANGADIAQTHALLHGEEQYAVADAGYLGVEKRPEMVAQHPEVDWHIAAKRGRIKALPEGPLQAATLALEKVKAQQASQRLPSDAPSLLQVTKETSAQRPCARLANCSASP